MTKSPPALNCTEDCDLIIIQMTLLHKLLDLISYQSDK